MTKRKKKPSKHKVNSLAQAQYRNEFFRNIRVLINEICKENLYSHIPQHVLDLTYFFRCHPLRIEAAAESGFENKYINEAKSLILHGLKTQKINIPDSSYEISLTDYLTYGLTICLMPAIFKNNVFPKADIVDAAIMSFRLNSEFEKKVYQLMLNLFDTFSSLQLNITKSIIWSNYNLHVDEKSLNNTFTILTLYREKADIKYIKVKNKARPLYRVACGFCNEGVKEVKLTPEILNIKGSFSKIPLSVYAQSHTFFRLRERVDCIVEGLVHFNMYMSLNNPKVAYDVNKRTLIEYRLFDTKIGYFRVDVFKGIIVVRTFLFLTNSSTPEGQLLQKNTGLHKLDNKYLALDKLSSFMVPDIAKNEEIKKIFEMSGCSVLLNIYDKFNPLQIKKSHQLTSNVLEQYLNYDKSYFQEIEKYDFPEEID